MFKSIPVATSQVSGTHTNFPVLVKPSVITGLGLITLAQAQSVRFYSDSDKTTELAREIVSADIIYVKIPSLSVSSVIYIDYDGVRSDYGVTDTYGRNNVWTEFVAVWHLQEAVNTTTDGYIDSTGNSPGTGVSMALAAVTSPVGDAQDFDGSSDRIDIPSTSELSEPNTNQKVSITQIIKLDATGQLQDYTFSKGNNRLAILYGFNTNVLEFYSSGSGAPRFVIGTLTDTASFHHISAVFDGAANTGRGFLDNVKTTETETGALPSADSLKASIACAYDGGGNPANFLNGKIAETRLRSDAVSDNYNEAEYNNLMDNGSFWGTAVTIASSPVFKPQISSIL